jgi:hypothetical protein
MSFVQKLNPLNFDPVVKRVLNNNPRLKKKTDAIWDEGITGRRARAYSVDKSLGNNYETLI